MKKLFVVMQGKWHETDEQITLFDHSVIPVAAFDSKEGARRFIADEMSKHPSDKVHSDCDDQFVYDDDGHEFDVLEIFELPLTHVRNGKTNRIINDLAKWITDIWKDQSDTIIFTGLPRNLSLNGEWSKETDDSGNVKTYLDLNLVNSKGKKVRESCYTSYSKDDAVMLANAIIKEVKEGTYKSK